jgi:GxxExxY protein
MYFFESSRLCVRSFLARRDFLFLLTENSIARLVVDSAYRVHSTLGPGLLESVYQAVLALELANKGLRHVCQQPVPVFYGPLQLKLGFRADIVVEDKVVIEIKSVEAVTPVHKKQLLTYLRLMDRRLGLLINFNVVLIKNGITRVVNGLQE